MSARVESDNAVICVSWIGRDQACSMMSKLQGKRKPAPALGNAPALGRPSAKRQKCCLMAKDAKRMISTLPPEEGKSAKEVINLMKKQRPFNVVSLCSGTELQESMSGSSEH